MPSCRLLTVMSEKLCDKGCGCQVAKGFKTCCKGCATRGVHDGRCLGPPVQGYNPISTVIGAPDENPEMTLPAGIGDEVPSCLPPARWSNRDVPPVKWGMRCKQFSDFLRACSLTQSWDEEVKGSGYVNLYALNGRLLINWTRQTGCGIALRMNPMEPLAAELMVSHCWAEDMQECKDALDEFRVQQNISQDAVLWFCAFSQYQAGHEPGDVGPTIPEQLALDPFGVVVAHVSSCLGMVVVHTSRAEIYSRLWCVYEIAEAVKSGSKVKVACSLDYVNTGAGNLAEMLQARTEEARCKFSDDEQLIRDKITQKMRWMELDRMIFRFRYEALRELMQRHADKLKSTIAAELKNLCSFEPQKKESTKVKESACLSKPPVSSEVAREAAAEEKDDKAPGVVQRFCSIVAGLFQPPPTLVESHAPEEPVSWRKDGEMARKQESKQSKTVRNSLIVL